MLKVPQTIINAIIKNQKKIYGGAISPGWDIRKQVEENYNEERAKRDFEEIKKHIPVNKKDKILDVGCGYGFFVATLRKMGYQCFGYDIDESSVKVAKQLLKENKLVENIVALNDDKNIPYPPETFDLINLNYVLLYVQDWMPLFKGILKVLKKDGKIYLITPNYQCGYDVNYGLPLLYFLPKWLNKQYLRLMGRKNTAFFESFNFTTKNKLEKLFSKYRLEVEDAGLEKWLSEINFPEFEGRSRMYQKLIIGARRWHLNSLLSLMANFGFYTPLIYVLKKKW